MAMDIVILAAGRGSRLCNKQAPKPLTVLANGQSILGCQLAIIREKFPSAFVRIVVGYRKEDIMAHFPGYHFIINDNWANENTSKSLLKGIQDCRDDLLWINGDVVFHPHALDVLTKKRQSAMLVNQSPVGSEEVKYRTNENGKIIEVSKIVQQPQGEAVGVNLFLAGHLPALREQLINCQPNDYFEKGIEGAINQQIDVFAAVIDHAWCKEIDYPEDLVEANRLLLSW